MRVPWTNQDIKSLGVYSLCPKCGHGKTRYHRKRQIEMDNKADDRKFRVDMKAHEAKISKGEKSAPPKRNQQSLQVACCCGFIGFSFYGGTQYGLCSDGTCEICQCPCTFVCKLSNYNSVKMERLAKDNPPPVAAAVDNTREYLNSATSLKDTSIAFTKGSYLELQSEGKLGRNDNDGTMRAISHQASLAASNNILHNLPGPRARQQLAGQMSLLNHAKGASWIRQHGVDRNLAGTGAERRVTNNRLKGALTHSSDSDDEDIVHVVCSHSNRNVLIASSAMKTSSSKKSAADVNVDEPREKVIRLRNACKKSISYDTDYDELEESEKKKQGQQMKALKYYSKAIRENACEEVTGMLVDGEDDWEPGQSQSMHQQVMNTRAYEY
jgi:hypothetical protein